MAKNPNVHRRYLSPDEARRIIKVTARVGRLGERDKLLIINKAGIIFDGPNAELERKEDLWALF